MKRIIHISWYLLAALCFLVGTTFLTVFTAVRFTGFLLYCAGVAIVLWTLLGRWSNTGQRWAVWCRRIFLLLLAVGLLLFAIMEIWVISWARTDDDTPVSAVVVFGAGVNGTVPSLSLRVRLDAAWNYLQDKPDIPIVVSGSQGAGEDISEARCMADWLIARGIADERIILEEQAGNTEENVRYSIALLAEHGINETDNIAFVTSDYHLCRAVRLYDSPNVVPVAARMPGQYWPLTLNYFIREAFAMAELVLLPDM